MTCPRCSEDIAELVTVRSREFVGDEFHGGIVEYEDEVCELCVKEEKLRDCEEFTDQEIAKIMDEYKSELLRIKNDRNQA